jgi:N-acetylneuraminic acid mutarotase
MRHLLCLLCLPLACAPVDEGPTPRPLEHGWEARAPLPEALQEIGVVSLAGRVWVIGGFNAIGFVQRSLWSYDPASDEWERKADLPAAVHHPNAAVAAGKIVIAGFLQNPFFDPDPRVFLYDPATDEWTNGQSMPPGTERGGAQVAAVGSRVFVFGGLRRGVVSDASVYDVDTDAWSELPPLPAPRDHGVAGAIDGVVYIAGGREGSIASHRPTLYAFDNGVWREEAPLPTSRAGTAGAVLSGRLFVFGGEGNPEDPNRVFAEVEAYDPETGAWEPFPAMPTPRHGMGAAVLDGMLFVPGGGDRDGFATVATHEALRPSFD